MEQVNRYRIAAVHRALMLLNTLAENSGSNPSQLAHQLKANRSLTFRLLRTLADCGFAIKDPSGGYRLGPQLLYLGQHVESTDALISQSAQSLDQLHEETQEHICLSVRDGRDLRIVADRRSTRAVRVAPGVGTRGGLYTGGGAKVLLAFAPPEIQRAVLRGNLKQFVPPKLRSRAALLKALRKIREDGHYIAVNEIADDVASISAVIRDGAGDALAVLTLLGPTSRIATGAEKRLLARVRQEAAAISQRITWSRRGRG